MNWTGKKTIEEIANLDKADKEMKIIMNYRCHERPNF